MTKYKELLKDVDEVRFTDIPSGSTVVPFRVAIYATRANELMQYMESQKIQCRTFFYPLHKQPAFGYLKEDEKYKGMMDDANFTGSAYAYKNGVCLPSYAHLPEQDLYYVCDRIKTFYASK